MQTDPTEMRLCRTPRGEAVRRAARLLAENRQMAVDTPSTSGVLDEAFADLAVAPSQKRNEKIEVMPIDTALLSTQLRQLDAQRERLVSLLADLDAK